MGALRAGAGPVGHCAESECESESPHNYGHVCIKFVESLGCTPGESTDTQTETRRDNRAQSTRDPKIYPTKRNKFLA